MQRQRLYNEIFANVLQRTALHAASLELEHPRTGHKIHTRSPVPEDMAKVIEMLGGDTAEIEKQLMTGSPHDKQPDICQAL